MTRCETSRLGDIPHLVSCLPQRMLRGNVKIFNVIFKKMGEESTSVVELALEGHSLFISSFKYCFKPKLSKGQCQISKSLTAPLLLAAVSIFSKHKWHVRKQTIGNRSEFFYFILLKETFWRK